MNQALAGLVADVYTLTNRPDLVGETVLAVKNATLKAHKQDYFYKDIAETGIKFDYSQAQQTLDYKSLIPRWRSLKYLRKYNNNIPGAFLELLTPDSLLDSYSQHRENVCYVAGIEIKIRCTEQQQYFLLGCYVFPDITTENFNSWIADESPSTIVYEAAAVVFKTIGYDEQASQYRELVKEEYALLKQSNIEANGS